MPGNAFAQAVAEVAGLFKTFIAGKEVARLNYRAEAAMEYVAVDEGSGKYEGINDRRKKRLKLHFRKRIFDVS